MTHYRVPPAITRTSSFFLACVFDVSQSFRRKHFIFLICISTVCIREYIAGKISTERYFPGRGIFYCLLEIAIRGKEISRTNRSDCRATVAIYILYSRGEKKNSTEESLRDCVIASCLLRDEKERSFVLFYFPQTATIVQWRSQPGV